MEKTNVLERIQEIRQSDLISLSVNNGVNTENNGIILFCWRTAFADIISLKTSVNLYEKMNNKTII